MRRNLIKLSLAMFAMIAAAAVQAAPGLANLAAVTPIRSCASLTDTDIATAVSAPVTNLSASEVAGDQPYCKVTGTIAPKINFEVRLPSRVWTQRFLQTGCGGLCGNLRVQAEKARGCLPVTNGEIALASTDMGHQGMDMAWGGNAQQRADFAHRGVHLTAVAAKALIAAYYGQAPRYSYFSGCSDGGREALIAAQRYPKDYDGIAAGAPALHFTVQNSFYHAWQALSNKGADGKPILNPADMPTLNNAAIAQCDAIDGLKDGQITDPRRCRFDPAVTLCKSAYEAGRCLIAAQVAAARKLYDGPRDESGRRLTIGGPMPGSELSWSGVFVPRQAGGMIFSEKIALDTIQNLLWSPNPEPGYKLADFKFTAATFRGLEPARKLYNADDHNLGAFAGHGGKLILWHGWNDQHISPLNSIDYFDGVGSVMGNAKRNAAVRLFMLPGVGHCSGGDGPSDFPLLHTLMAWVEGGSAPDVLTAERPAPASPPAGMTSPPPIMTGPAPEPRLPPRSRPIYAYPQVAAYVGSGSIDAAENFTPAKGLAAKSVKWLGQRR